MSQTKPSILIQLPQRLTETITQEGIAKFRARQIANWIYSQKVMTPEEMTNLPNSIREFLKNSFECNPLEVIDTLECSDGATKLLIKGTKGHVFETVVLRYQNRVSVCLSSQVGCKMSCSFCQTGKLGFFRSLSSHEILCQFMIASNIAKKEGRKVTHVVFMGMGEPLDNFDNVVEASNTLIDPQGFGLSRRKVTISTSGIADRLALLASKTTASLAVSLHAARDELRSELMPLNRKFPLKLLKKELLNYQSLTDEKITFEYILIKGKNCHLKEAKELVNFLHGFRAKVNLIPFNPHPGMPYKCPDEKEMLAFQNYLASKKIPAPIRYSKGADVSAACGQLAGKKQDHLHQKPLRANITASMQKSTPFFR